MALILNGTDGLSDVDGTAATPAIRGTDTNTGIFFPAADTIAFAEGGTEVARFDSAGNLGIGTTSPAYKLDVNGTLTANGSQEVMRIAAADSSQAGGINIKSVYGNSASDRVTTILSVDGQGQDSPLAFGTGTSERMRITSTGQLRTTVTGTTMMDEYGCRAWVNFNGTGTVAIRASGNVSSITDNGTGDYTVNFTTAMPDTDYSVAGTAQQNTAGSRGDWFLGLHQTAQTTSARRVSSVDSGGNPGDALVVNVQIFR